MLATRICSIFLITLLGLAFSRDDDRRRDRGRRLFSRSDLDLERVPRWFNEATKRHYWTRLNPAQAIREIGGFSVAGRRRDVTCDLWQIRETSSHRIVIDEGHAFLGYVARDRGECGADVAVHEWVHADKGPDYVYLTENTRDPPAQRIGYRDNGVVFYAWSGN